MIFDIDFNRWIALMLPTFLRRPRIYALCRALCAPLFDGDDAVYTRFLEARDNHNYRLGHTGQVGFIRQALNDAFGLSRGFEICDAVSSMASWRYIRDQETSGQLLIPEESEGGLLMGDENHIRTPNNRFIVMIPQAFAENLDAIRAIVDRYRLCSKHPVYIISDNQVKYKNEQSELC